MNFEITKFFENFEKNLPIELVKIQEVAKAINLDLPSEYLEIFSFMNGGEGFIGDNFCRLYPLDELVSLNESFSVKEFAPEIFIFGSNGGGEAFAFNIAESPYVIIKIPFIPMDLDFTNLIGQTVSEFFSSFSTSERRTLLEINRDLIGKEIHEKHPVVFGGDPIDPNNKTFVPTKNYAELVVFWNKIWHSRKTGVAK